jgi:DNA-binding transcriptional regulator YiaG
MEGLERVQGAMPKSCQHATAPAHPRSQTVKRIREVIGRTQAELGATLGVSAKAVQSWEQGWREVPDRVMTQLLVLLALYRRHTMEEVPCWEVRRCPAGSRDRCSAFAIGRGQFCFYIGSKECAPDAAGREADAGDGLPCLRCSVVHRLLRGPAHASPEADAP